MPIQINELSPVQRQRILNVNDRTVKELEHEVNDAEDRSAMDDFYDEKAMAFLLDVAPFIQTAIAKYTRNKDRRSSLTSSIESQSSPSDASSKGDSSGFSAAVSPDMEATGRDLAEKVYDRLCFHLDLNKQLPDDYPSEPTPHLRSLTYRLWYYLIAKLIFLQPQCHEIVAVFLVAFFSHAKEQERWNTWQISENIPVAEDCMDLRVRWMLKDYVSQAPNPVQDPTNLTPQEEYDRREYVLASEFNAHLAVHDNTSLLSFASPLALVFSFATIIPSSSTNPRFPCAQKADTPIIALEKVWNVSGELLFFLCGGNNGAEVNKGGRYYGLLEEIDLGKAELEEEEKFTKENWERWMLGLKWAAEGRDRREDVRRIAEKVRTGMEGLVQKYGWAAPQ